MEQPCIECCQRLGPKVKLLPKPSGLNPKPNPQPQIVLLHEQHCGCGLEGKLQAYGVCAGRLFCHNRPTHCACVCYKEGGVSIPHNLSNTVTVFGALCLFFSGELDFESCCLGSHVHCRCTAFAVVLADVFTE
jgi:hypothetical protein